MAIVVGMEMHSVANLATLQTPLATSLQKSTQTLFSFWDSPVLPRECEVLLSQRMHTSLSLSFSLSLSVHQLCSASGGEEQHFHLNTDVVLLL